MPLMVIKGMDTVAGAVFFQNITSNNVRFILDGSGSMSACVAWITVRMMEIRDAASTTHKRGYFRTYRICSFTRMEALQNEMINIINNLPDYTKIGLFCV